MQNKKETQKGITLIALIITIIVMLILVGVTIGVATSGGLFKKANDSAKETEKQAIYEQTIASTVLDNNGKLDIDATGNVAEAHFNANGLSATWVYTQATNSGILTVQGKYGTYEIEISAAGIGQQRITTASTGGNGSGGNTTNNYLAALTQEQQTGGLRLVSYDSLSEDLKTAVTEEKVSAVVQETIGGETLTAVIPANFTIDSEAFKISEGLVIKDSNNNEFVWIPVPGKNMQASYTVDNCSEPTVLTFTDLGDVDGDGVDDELDSQATLTYYYGTQENSETPYFNYVTDFNYASHYAEMVASVNKYGGFYIGRYETTIDSSNNIGSKFDTQVLTNELTLREGTGNSGEPYYYRWWGLYYAQRRTNVVGLGTAVQTNMIWGQQWDKMIEYFGSHSIDYSETKVGTLLTTGEQNSGQAKYSYNGATINDVIYNIYDLRGNTMDWTAEESYDTFRVFRGGHWYGSNRHSADYREHERFPVDRSSSCSRATLYIK